MSVRARTTDADGSTAWSAPAPVAVNVKAVADAATMSATASGNEDTAIPVAVSLALQDADGSESVVHVEVSGIPAGATLGWNTGLPGTVTTPAADTVRFAGTLPQLQALLASLTITPPPTATPISASPSPRSPARPRRARPATSPSRTARRS